MVMSNVFSVRTIAQAALHLMAIVILAMITLLIKLHFLNLDNVSVIMGIFLLLELVNLMLHVVLQNIMMAQIIVYLVPRTVLPVPTTQEIVKLVLVLSLYWQVSHNNALVKILFNLPFNTLTK
jgi:hypothetical protein